MIIATRDKHRVGCELPPGSGNVLQRKRGAGKGIEAPIAGDCPGDGRLWGAGIGGLFGA